MNITKLLNPVSSKRLCTYSSQQQLRQISPAARLPAELIAQILLYFQGVHRAWYAQVCKQWQYAYNLFHRNSYFSIKDHVSGKNVTKNALLRSFRKYGHRVRIMHTTSEILVVMLHLEPNFGELVSNVQHLFVRLTHRISSEMMLGKFVSKLSQLREVTFIDRGYAPDEYFSAELDKALVNKPFLSRVESQDIELNAAHFPGPNLKAAAAKIQELVFEVSNFEANDLVSALEPFRNLTSVGLCNFTSLEVMYAAVQLITDPRSLQSLKTLHFLVDLDITRTPPIHDDEGNKVMAMTLVERVCGIKRPKFELVLRLMLGACSTNDTELIEKERQFISNLGKNYADVFYALNLIHLEPVGDYDPVTTFLFEGGARYLHLTILRLDIPMSLKMKEKLAAAVNNTFLLPNLQATILRIDGQLYGDLIKGYSPVDASREMQFIVEDVSAQDQLRQANESATVPISAFAPGPEVYD
ncbi:hypothetical protein GQ42DRAFT_155887 [Ramicandelaber brevisporus]|nr:hypothetical protein GQ42DRAFT_155887 [Ramicandelaber brevisporus]